MTAFARKVLDGLPAPTTSGTANNYAAAAAVHQRHGQGRRQGRRPGQPAAVGLRPLRLARRRHLRSAADPAAVGRGGNGFTYVTNKQFAVGSTWSPTGQLAARVRFGWSNDGRRQESRGARICRVRSEAFGIAGLPTDQRVAGGLPTQLITGFSDLGRQATNPQWQYPTVFNPKVNYTWLMGRHSLKSGYEFQHIQTEVQDVNPLYGRDQYAGQFTAPGRRDANNLYNLADFMLGAAQHLRAEQHPRREPAAEHALRLPAGRPGA